MQYTDPYNFPQDALRSYDVNGGVVTPSLHHGTIFRVVASESFILERLENQIDGAEFFLEIYNEGVVDIVLSFDDDYRATSLLNLSQVIINAGEVVAYDIICRIGLMLVYNQTGYVPDVDYLRNPADNAILINPKTGLPLINPGE